MNVVLEEMVCFGRYTELSRHAAYLNFGKQYRFASMPQMGQSFNPLKQNLLSLCIATRLAVNGVLKVGVLQ